MLCLGYPARLAHRPGDTASVSYHGYHAPRCDLLPRLRAGYGWDPGAGLIAAPSPQFTLGCEPTRHLADCHDGADDCRCSQGCVLRTCLSFFYPPTPLLPCPHTVFPSPFKNSLSTSSLEGRTRVSSVSQPPHPSRFLHLPRIVLQLFKRRPDPTTPSATIYIRHFHSFVLVASTPDRLLPKPLIAFAKRPIHHSAPISITSTTPAQTNSKHAESSVSRLLLCLVHCLPEH